MPCVRCFRSYSYLVNTGWCPQSGTGAWLLGQATMGRVGDKTTVERLTDPAVLRRGAALIAGWLLIALSIVLLVRVRMGMAPYDVLNTAIAARLGVATGTASWLACAVLVLLAALLGARPGIGTVAGAFVVGGMINVGLAATSDVQTPSVRLCLFVVALGLMYSGVCGIVVSQVGAGPTELVTIGLLRRGVSVRTARWSVEGGCLLIGAALGGSFGPGTIVIMLVSGPVLAFLLPRAQLLVAGGRATHGNEAATSWDDLDVP